MKTDFRKKEFFKAAVSSSGYSGFNSEYSSEILKNGLHPKSSGRKKMSKTAAVLTSAGSVIVFIFAYLVTYILK